MKKLFAVLLAAILASGMMSACTDKMKNTAQDEMEEPLKEGWTYSEKKLVGYWETIHPLYNISWGYRFNEDGSIDMVEDRAYSYMGIYECRQDGVHYSQDGENWDELVMEIISLTDTEMTVDFEGEQTTFTKSDAELIEYMPYGWSYVEG